MTRTILFLIVFLKAFCLSLIAQSTDGYWQQEANYNIDVSLNTQNHQYYGRQSIEYVNHSPDTLKRTFFHLYYNAFQPFSMMDARSRNIPDPDARIEHRILHLDSAEMGYLRIENLTQNGDSCTFEEAGTILEVNLAQPLKPGDTATFKLDFEGQVPVQIRRSGRNNAEGIDYSMSQWYPKISEYDHHGWHADPYVEREFHGVWGSFDVKITLNSSYTVAGTGVLQNQDSLNDAYFGNENKQPSSSSMLPGGNTPENQNTWHFKADSVHDFMWAADPDYVQDTLQVPGGPLLRFFYQPDTLTDQWKKLPEFAGKAFQFMQEKVGEYPYPEYSIIQGGDGGMEYPMATLITGHRSFTGLVGVTTHELVHSWFQFMLANNENMYAWMDEGFTTYYTNEIINSFYKNPKTNPQARSQKRYISFTKQNKAEPLRIHADHYQTNAAYSNAAYSKGAVMLQQLEYVIGTPAFDKGMQHYFDAWKFKHPGPVDFKRVMEKTSGIELDWFFHYWINTTHTVDYGVDTVFKKGENQSEIVLEKNNPLPMPIDVLIEFNDGNQQHFYIPLRVMRNEKPLHTIGENAELLKDWPWTHPQYKFTIDREKSAIKKIELNPDGKLADVDSTNNVYPGDN